MKKLIVLCSMLLVAVSCNADDDICVSGEATPRLKIKFKEGQNQKLVQLSRIIVDVDYGSQTKTVINQTAVDSLLIPLRVDGNPYTDIYVSVQESGAKSKIRINYIPESQYVSPACGFKKLYKDLKTSLEQATPVTNVEQPQTEITNENNTHLYLVF